MQDSRVNVSGSSGRRVVVLGGTSEIATAIVLELLRRGPREVVLVGRDAAGLDVAVGRLMRAGCSQASAIELDADDTHLHETVLAEALERLGGADLVLLAVGLLGERGGVPRDVGDALDVLRVNVVGAGSMLICAARLLQAQGSGTLVVLSSVAGERVRPGNVVYGAAKAGLDALAQGLGDALHGDGVGVLIVRPGFVNTRMTRGLRQAPFAIESEDVARAVIRGLDHRKRVVWAPPSLRWLMLVLRMMPRRLLRLLPA
jgi:decaprenylphospho-beta-D-erythro-pentofuranosid-2-ulose 2-reductase